MHDREGVVDGRGNHGVWAAFSCGFARCAYDRAFFVAARECVDVMIHRE